MPYTESIPWPPHMKQGSPPSIYWIVQICPRDATTLHPVDPFKWPILIPLHTSQWLWIDNTEFNTKSVLVKNLNRGVTYNCYCLFLTFLYKQKLYGFFVFSVCKVKETDCMGTVKCWTHNIIQGGVAPCQDGLCFSAQAAWITRSVIVCVYGRGMCMCEAVCKGWGVGKCGMAV